MRVAVNPDATEEDETVIGEFESEIGPGVTVRVGSVLVTALPATVPVIVVAVPEVVPVNVAV